MEKNDELKDSKNMVNTNNLQGIDNVTSINDTGNIGNTEDTTRKEQVQETEKAEKSTVTENSVNKNQKSNKKKIIAGVACVVVIAGVITGVVLYNQKSSENTSKTAAETGNTVTQYENSVQKTEENNANKDEVTKSTPKVDESKPWVYNSNYGDGREPKTITNNTGKIYSSTDELIVPYININSEYANYINSELKNIFEENYNSFGGANDEKEILEGYLPQISYEYAVADNVLSVVITKHYGIINGDSAVEYEIYNFNLTTLNKASLSDLYKQSGFESEDELKSCAQAAIENEVASGNLLDGDAELNFSLCYLDKNSNLNMLVKYPTANMGPIVIRKGSGITSQANNVETIMNTENAEYESPTADGLSVKITDVPSTANKSKKEESSFYFYAPNSWDCEIDLIENSSYKINSNDEYYEIRGKVNGEYKLAFSILLSNSTSYFNSSWVNIGKYSDGKYIYQMQNFVCRDSSYTDDDYKFENEVTEALDSLMIKYVVMNEYGSADTMKTLEGKYFFQGEPETSARGSIYYIKNGNLCRTELSDGFHTEILAGSVASLYYNSTDNKIHATAQGSFTNRISTEDNGIVYDIR